MKNPGEQLVEPTINGQLLDSGGGGGREHEVMIVPKEKSKGPKSDKYSMNDDELLMDTGMWGWVVCFTSFWTNGTIFGVFNSYGTMQVKLKEEFKSHPNAEALIPLVGSLCIGITFLLSSVAGILTDRCGIRKIAFVGSILSALGMLLSSFVDKLELLYLTYGLMVGIGASLTYSPSLVILGHYFKRYMGIVNGVVTFGSSVFTIVLPLVMDELLKKVGLRVTFQILSGLMATLLLCSLSFVPRLETRRTVPLEEQYSSSQTLPLKTKCRQFFVKFINVSIWQNKRYVIWALTISTALFGYFVPFIHLAEYAKKNFPNDNGSLLVTCIGATSGVGRLVFGKLSDFPWVNRIFLQQISFISIGVLTMLIPAAGYFPVLIAICLGLGLFDGCFISLLGPIAFDLTGAQGASQAIGFLLGFCSIPLTAGPPIAGWIEGETGSYTIPFICAGIPGIVGALMMCLINRVKAVPASDEIKKETKIVISNNILDTDGEATKLMSDSSSNSNIWQKQMKSAGSQTETDDTLSAPSSPGLDPTPHDTVHDTGLDEIDTEKMILKRESSV